MTDLRTAEIAELEKSIAQLEAQQRAGIDLALPLRLQRERLAQLLEQAVPQVISNQSGGIDVMADRVDIGGDAVGRDKITLHTETITASDHSVALKDSDVRGDTGGDPAANQALLARYLK